MSDSARDHAGSEAVGPASGPPVRRGRRYGDTEIARILQAAAELQERASALPDGYGRGLTLEELRQIAAEAGIDPRYVDLAVRAGDGPLERIESRVSGGPVEWRFHSEIEGALSDEDRGRILQVTRAVIGQKGEFADVYGRMEWSYDDGLGPAMVGVAERDGYVEVDVSATRSGEAALIHTLGVPFGGMVGGAVMTALLGVEATPGKLGLVLASAVVCYLLGRLGWAARSAWWERRLNKLVERIGSVVQDRAALPTPEPDGPA